MLTIDDKKFIADLLNQTLDKRFKIIDQKFDKIDKRFEDLTKDIIDLFDVTNSRIEKVLEAHNEHRQDIDNHELRIGKIEEKVFATTSS